MTEMFCCGHTASDSDGWMRDKPIDSTIHTGKGMRMITLLRKLFREYPFKSYYGYYEIKPTAADFSAPGFPSRISCARRSTALPRLEDDGPPSNFDAPHGRLSGQASET